MKNSMVFDVGSKRQLFTDHRFIEASEGIVLTVNEARKHPEPVLVADRPWESMCIGGYFTILEEDGRYRLWYDSFASDYKSDADDRLCYAVSDDGLHWEKPELGLIEFQGSKKNNIVLEDIGGDGYHGGTVFIDPSARPEERYKILYQAEGRTRGDFMRGACSPDGIHWKKYPGILADHLSDTQTVVYHDERLKKYVGYFRLWTGGKEKEYRAIGRSETEDFLHWPRDPALVLAPDEFDPVDMHMYTNAYHQYREAADAHFFLIASFYSLRTGMGKPLPLNRKLPLASYTATDCVDIQLAVSRNGILWYRPDRRPFIRLGNEGDPDSGSIYAGVGVIPKGDEIWIYYTCLRHKHGEAYPNIMSYAGQLRIAKVRRDGFVSADAGYRGGYILTPPLKFCGSRLELNYDAGAGGFVSVEILDNNGWPVKGLAKDDCDLLRGSSTAKAVTWKGESDVSCLAGKPIRLRITMRDVRLYAFQFC